MIVNDDTVSKALAYLAEDPHPLAISRHALTLAENTAKQKYAEALLAADGAVEIRKAKAEVDAVYQAAKTAEADAVRELERHRARAKAADMICEIWRSDQANVRAAEKVR